MRPPVLRLQLAANELIVDNFAGGGGASTGIEAALGRSPDIAINHDPEALAMHEANHPATRHFREDVFAIDPVAVCGGRPVGLAWFSPDCTYFSKSRGGKPFRDRNKARRRRGLAGIVIKWARLVAPRVIALENVEEFADWGPLDADGRPCPLRKGFSFRRWRAQLENLGYRVEMRQLRACDYGAPTVRKRLFILARRDGQPIVWPEPTHGPRHARPHRAAAECIDWAIPCPSIFDRKKPLADATLRRIARGIFKYVLGAGEPFIVPVTHPRDARVHAIGEPLRTITAGTRGEHALVQPFMARIGHTGGGGKYVNEVAEPLTTITTKAEHLLVAPSLIQTGRGERSGQAPRALDLQAPLGTVCAGGSKHALVSAFLARHYGDRAGGFAGALPLSGPAGTVTVRDHHAVVTSSLLKLYGTSTGAPLEQPMPTVTAGGWHLGEVRAFLLAYYSTEQRAGVRDPLPTITTHDRFALVTVAGQEYVIADIGMRMLAPHELAAAQGFPAGYELAPRVAVVVKRKSSAKVTKPAGRHGKRQVTKPLSKTAQIRMIGNSVCPPVAAAIVRAQFIEGAAAARGDQLGLAGVA